MLLTSWIQSLRRTLNANRSWQSKRPITRAAFHRRRSAPTAVERLEDRTLLASPTLISVTANVGDFIEDGQVRHDSPRDLVFQFSPGQEIDATTLDGIRFTRAGLNDQFDVAFARTDFNTGGAVVLNFEAQDLGDAGNGITLNFTHSDHGGASLPLVDVVDSTINVNLNSNPGNESTAADLVDALNGSPDASLLLTASVESGSDATDIVTPAFRQAAATSDFNTAGAVEVTFTAVPSGEAGNDVAIEVTQSDHGGAGAPTVTVNGSLITVDLNTNSAGPSTAADLVDAINEDAAASALVSAAVTSGDEETDLASAAISGSPLELTGAKDVSTLVLGGADSATGSADLNSAAPLEIQFTSTVAGAMGNDTSIVITKSDHGGPGGPTITVVDATVTIDLNTNPGNETTARQLVDAINADPDAAALVRAALPIGDPEADVASSAVDGTTIDLGGVDDVVITPGFIGIGEQPNEVIVRFSEMLPDDIYRIDVLGSGPTPLTNMAGEVFNSGVNVAIDFEIDLGAQVIAVVPQPVTRNASGQLNQDREQVIVYFNNDELDASLAKDPRFYQLIDASDDSIMLPSEVEYDSERNVATLKFAADIPDGTYRLQVGESDESNKTLDTALNAGTLFDANEFQKTAFLGDEDGTNDVDLYRFQLSEATAFTATVEASNSLNTNVRLFREDGDEVGVNNDDGGVGGTDVLMATLGPGTYYLGVAGSGNIGYSAIDGNLNGSFGVGGTGSYTLTLTADADLVIDDDNSSFDTATALGNLGAAGQWFSSQIEAQDHMFFPPYPGGVDEPGHRQIPPENHYLGGVAGTGSTMPGGIATQYYNFQENYGAPVLGVQLKNAITEPQKQRAREIFEIYGHYFGVQFIESANQGITVVTGDPRAVVDTLPPGTVPGIARLGEIALMDASQNFGDSEYGGFWFRTALHEIGHAIGLDHSYDIPSVQGDGLTGEPVFPGDHDLVHFRRIFRPDSTDIDVYRFDVTETGWFTAETIAERQTTTSLLDTVLTLYRENGATREMIARNDDFHSNDSFIGLELEPGTYYIAVTSTGNTGFDPTVPDSGFGGTTEGDYELKLNFQPESPSSLLDTTGNDFDGDADGAAGGAYNFWFQSSQNTIFVDKAAAPGGDGSLIAPYNIISDAVNAAEMSGTTDIIRIVGNGGDDGDVSTVEDNLPYELGINDSFVPHADGVDFEVPQGVTLMIDAGALFKLESAIIDVGSPPQTGDRSEGALQVLGTPEQRVYFTSIGDDAKGGDSDELPIGPRAGDWGGLVFRDNSDLEENGVFLNYVNHADLAYGGGRVLVGSIEDVYTPIHMVEARPTVSFNRVTNSAGAALSADPNSFDDSDGRIGPDIYGNQVVGNSVNGLFVRIRVESNVPVDTLDVGARWDDLDIVHVVTENLLISGTPGGPLDTTARLNGRLKVDPGVVVKLSNARIESTVGGSQLIAEGTESHPIVFTSLTDDRFGAGGTFDTNRDGSNSIPAPGQWGGLMFNATSRGSIDHAYIAYGGGDVPFENGEDDMSVIEVHQADFRLTNSIVERNAGNASATNRQGRGRSGAATIFVRGAQPILVDNLIRHNAGNMISVNANAMQSRGVVDWGRSTGPIERYSQFNDNHGPLVRLNRIWNNGTNGMEIRGEELTTETVWDDTDIVHVLRSEIVINNHHTYSGLRLQSSATEGLVVKLDGENNAGFTANGVPLDIDDRIGGTIHIVGRPGFPVVLTSLKDDTVGASFDPEGRPHNDTNNDGGNSSPQPGDWRSIRLDRYSNDRNVALVQENEKSHTEGNDTNGNPGDAQFLGELAPNEKSGDDTRRLGFEVHGFISPDAPNDVDVYSFTAVAGTEVWLDIDRTDSSLDTVLELISGLGTLWARSTSNSELQSTPIAQALDMNKDSWLGGDFYTLNPLDAGMRVILPGTPGVEGTYYVRVRSNPEPSEDIGELNHGQTSGKYELEVRLRQVDEKPGSNVVYSDIRYATNGIEVFGLPGHSPLVAESGEADNTANNAFNTAQSLGNLLTTDRNTISVSGSLSSATDVDWYEFELGYDLIQAIDGFNGGGKTWSTIFDIDYADGLARPDTIVSVFDESGRLILVSRDSNIEDDQPGAGQGLDADDLSRGSFGKLDPYIGSVQMPAANPGETNVYYVAISSNARLPLALNATFENAAANPLIRLEPVNSVQRIVEDHIGFVGYTSGNSTSSSTVLPTSGPILEVDTSTQLSTHVKPLELEDVVLFVSRNDELQATNPASNATNRRYGQIAPGVNTMADIEMRSDGRLFGYESLPGVDDTAGRLVEIDWETGATTVIGEDEIPDFDPDTDPPDLNQATTDVVDALAFRRRAGDTPTYDLFYSVRVDDDPTDPEGVYQLNTSRLYRANPANGSAATAMNQPWGRVGEITGVNGFTTGMTFVGNTLYGVSDAGEFYTISTGNGSASVIKDDYGLSFRSLTLGPRNVENGNYVNTLFAITTNNQLVAIDRFTGALRPVFDGGTSASGFSGVTGLAFSPLDFNLWHPTMRRNTNAGHGINTAFDNSRNDLGFFTRNVGPENVPQNQSQGGASFYFGFEEWSTDPGSNGYFRYDGTNAQYGIRTQQFHRDLATHPSIGTNYNLPGGAYGSLETHSFSLSTYHKTDKPTLYFNYFLETPDHNTIANNGMRDSARVFISNNGGATWELLATNNDVPSDAGDDNAELPPYITASRDADIRVDNQHVQELFDNTGGWRQARIDLAKFAGSANLKLRFDFSTAGQMPDPVPGNAFGNLGHVSRGQNNNFEGFYIDDIIVGLAERGEMVTGAPANQTAFFTVPQNPDPVAPTESLVGPYQLEIRRGTEYGRLIDKLNPHIVLFNQFDSNDRMIREFGRLGDRNLHREQGHLQIDSNSISHVEEYGIVVDAGQRDGGRNFAHPGSTINHPTLNNQRLVPGVKIVNNVIAGFEDGGILFSGDPNSGNVPDAVVPYGRIVNNTIYGGESAKGIGINVTENAHPTILNNILANTATGIAVDGTSNGAGQTIVSSNLFRGNSNNGTTGTDPAFALPSDPLFVNPAAGNFYLAAGAPAIDRSRNNLSDRPSILVVKSPLDIPGSNVIAPGLDRFGQLRVDDPDEDPTGSGAEIFKDLGAIERADFSRPTSVLLVPEDNDPNGIDLDLRTTFAWVDQPELLTTFVIELRDIGIGIDDASIDSSQFELWQSGQLLTDGVDYIFSYNANTNQVSFKAFSGLFPLDNRYTITIDNSDETGVKDLAGNPIAANQTDGSTMFSIVVTDGKNDPPENQIPTVVQFANEDTPFVFSSGEGNAVSISDPDAFLDDDIVEVALTVVNGTLTLSDTTGLTFSAGDGDDDSAMTFQGTIADINAALEGMQFLAPADYFGPASIQIETDDLGKLGPPPSPAENDSDMIVITVNPVNDPPVNDLPLTEETDENVPLVFSSGAGNGISISDVDADGNEMRMTLTAENGVITLSGTTGLTFVDTDGLPENNPDNDGTEDVELRFTGTIADINAALEGLTFTPDMHYFGPASLTVATDDQGNSGSGGPQTDVDTIDITVHEVNKFFIDDATIVEGDAGQTMLAFDVRIALPAASTLEVKYRTVADTASDADGDYDFVDDMLLTFEPGDPQVKQILVPINGDEKVELDETFFVELYDGSVEIRDGEAVGTILNDDSATLSINDISEAEDTGDFTFTVTLDSAVDVPVSVDYATVELPGEAIAGTDYDSTSGTLMFDGNALEEQTFTVTVHADSLVELDELFAADIFNVSALGRDVTIGKPQGTAVIEDDDQATLSVNSVADVEEEGVLIFEVTLTGDVDESFTVDFFTSDLTDPVEAEAGLDYTPVTGTLTFDGFDGETMNVTVPIVPDTIAELDERFALNLDNVEAGGRDIALNPAQGIGTILDDDAATLSIDSVAADEDSGVLTFTVTLDGAVGAPFTVDYSTFDIPGQAVAGVDYTGASGVLNFDGIDGETQEIQIAMTADEIVELNETFEVHLGTVDAGGRDVTAVGGPGVGTIVNDDEAFLSIDSVGALEDSGELTFTVTLDGAVDVGFDVNVTTSDLSGEAVAGVDYTAQSSKLSFLGNDGETQTFTVSLTPDTVFEFDELFLATLSNVQASGRNVSIGNGQGTGTIINDDTATLTVSDAEGDENGGPLTFTVTLDGEVAFPFSVDFTTADLPNQAVGSVDYVQNIGTLNFSGTSGQSRTFTVNIIDDIVVELDEQFRVDLRNARSGGRPVDLTTVSGIGTIRNNDSATVSINNVTADEDSGEMRFTVSLFGAVDSPFTVNYATQEVPGGATENVDFMPGIGTVSFTGSLNQTRTIDVVLLADDAFESDEEFEVHLSNLQAGGRDVTIAKSRGVGRILNDDVPVAPTIIEPLTSSTTFDTTPTFRWTEVEGAARYDIWVNDLTAGISGIIRNATVPADADENGIVSYSDPFELTVGHFYIWTVHGIRDDGAPGVWAPHEVFRVVQRPIVTDVAISPPTILGPSHWETVPSGTNNVKFEWEPVPQAVRYDIWVNNLTTQQSGVIRNLNVTDNFLEATLPTGSYVWTVRAITDSFTASEFAPHAWFSVRPSLEAPTPFGPIGETVDQTPTFSWSAVEGAARYDLWVNNRTTGQVGIIRNMHIPGPSFTPATPLTNGNYIWTVRAIDASGSGGEWAPHAIFTINAETLVAPEILGPVGTTFSNPPVFTWTAVDGAARYDIWVNDLTTGESGVIRNTHVQGTTYSGQSLTRGHSYIWTVRAIDDTGNGGRWAGHRIFTVAQATPDGSMPFLDGGVAEDQDPESSTTEDLETVRNQDVMIVDRGFAESQDELETTVTATHDFVATVLGTEATQAAPFAPVTILAETRTDERRGESGRSRASSRATSDVMAQWHLEDWWKESDHVTDDEPFARAEAADRDSVESEQRPALFGKLLASASPLLLGRVLRRSRKSRRTQS